MFHYDEDGELQDSGEAELVNRMHVLTMLKTTKYGLYPNAAGKLEELLGDVRPQESKDEARRRLRQTLDTMGLTDTNFDVFVEALDQSWQAKIDVV